LQKLPKKKQQQRTVKEKEKNIFNDNVPDLNAGEKSKSTKEAKAQHTHRCEKLGGA